MCVRTKNTLHAAREFLCCQALRISSRTHKALKTAVVREVRSLDA